MFTDKHYSNLAGKFAVRAEESRRASKICNTQEEAEKYIKHLNPDDTPDMQAGGRFKRQAMPCIAT